MTQQIIPISAVPVQTFTVTLGSQQCTITITSRTTGLYFDLLVAGVQVVASVLCLDRMSLVRWSYLGFLGTLAFVDTQGFTDPVYTGLGARYQLVYLT